MTDTAWIDAALTSARPQAVGALLRYFRNLDTAEEAFQNACLRALKSWPQNGPPRDPAAWLIMVGRNVAIDDIRRNRRQQPLPDDDQAIYQFAGAEARNVRRFVEELKAKEFPLTTNYRCRDEIVKVMQAHPGRLGLGDSLRRRSGRGLGNRRRRLLLEGPHVARDSAQEGANLFLVVSAQDDKEFFAFDLFRSERHGRGRLLLRSGIAQMS